MKVRTRSPESTSSTANMLPPLGLPLCYLSFASLCFGLALLGAVQHPEDFTGFYYHPRILALTHLVTLGWITGNIVGTLYIVGPMTLQTRLAVRWLDHLVFWLYVIGVSGMVSHFWISHEVGMAWSAGCVYLALAQITVKVMRALRSSRVPGFVKFHIRLAFTNILVAGGWGLLVAVNKVYPFLPTSSSPNVLAHAHLAAIGWASMMVFGVAYRLLPMFLPGEPATGQIPWVSAILLEIGVVGLFGSLLTQSRLTLMFGLIISLGIVFFLLSALRTALQRKPAPPPKPPRPDFSLLHALSSFVCLIFSVASGLALTQLLPAPESLQLALAYGFVGLVGFLGQIVVGMKPKILSVFAWYHAFTRAGSIETVPRPVDMPIRPFQITGFALWQTGLLLFVSGVLLQSILPIRAGAMALFAALVISIIHEVCILRLMAGRNVRTA